jgi:hypothetical protein
MASLYGVGFGPSMPSKNVICAVLAASAVSASAEVSFRNDVMAAISKAGCNLGASHGKATGK